MQGLCDFSYFAVAIVAAGQRRASFCSFGVTLIPPTFCPAIAINFPIEERRLTATCKQRGNDMRWGFGLLSGTFACAALVIGAGSSATAQPASAAAVAPPGVIANFITAGAPDPNGKVPVIDGVPGAGVQNIAVASPLAILQHGHTYTLVLTSQNNTFRGICADSYVLRRGSIILASGKIHTYDCQPGTYWDSGRQTPQSSRTSPGWRR